MSASSLPPFRSLRALQRKSAKNSLPLMQVSKPSQKHWRKRRRSRTTQWKPQATAKRPPAGGRSLRRPLCQDILIDLCTILDGISVHRKAPPNGHESLQIHRSYYDGACRSLAFGLDVGAPNHDALLFVQEIPSTARRQS